MNRLIQKSVSIKIKFLFEEDHVYQQAKIEGEILSVKVPYQNILKDKVEYIFKNLYLMGMTYLLALLILFIVSMIIIMGKETLGFKLVIAAGGLFLISSLLFFIRFLKDEVTVFKTERGNLLIMRDKNYEKIIREIEKRQPALISVI
jgi:hypothetical protein